MLLVMLKQTVMMFLLMAVGFILFRTKKLSEKGNREMGTILLYLTLPCVIISSYMTHSSPEKLRLLGISAAAGAAALLVAILMSRFFFGSRRRMEHFCCSFSNAGFIGIPVIEAVLGNEAVFFVATFIALLNVFQWVYGAPVLAGNGKNPMSSKLYTNPVLIAFVIGLILFFTQVKLPSVITGAIGMLRSMNTPLAMIILGAYLGQMKLKELFTDMWTYICSAWKLIAIPVVTFGVLCLFPAEYLDIKIVVLIAASAPVGSNAPIFAERCGADSAQAVRCVSMSNLFSIINLPIIVAEAIAIWT